MHNAWIGGRAKCRHDTTLHNTRNAPPCEEERAGSWWLRGSAQKASRNGGDMKIFISPRRVKNSELNSSRRAWHWRVTSRDATHSVRSQHGLISDRSRSSWDERAELRVLSERDEKGWAISRKAVDNFFTDIATRRDGKTYTMTCQWYRFLERERERDNC